MSGNRNWTVVTVGLLAVGLLVAVAVSTSIAQVEKGKTRPMRTHDWMEGVMKPQSSALKEALDATPANDKAWAEVTMHAAILNEASYVLMADGRCPDDVWANAASKTLRDNSAALLVAAEAQDLTAAKKAFGATTAACKQCHDKHRE